MFEGILFKGSSEKPSKPGKKKVQTKAKKTAYVKGSHGSCSAAVKAEYRRKRANRNTK